MSKESSLMTLQIPFIYNTKYYQLIPLFLGLVSIVILAVVLLTHSSEHHHYHSLVSATTMQSLTSTKFREALFALCGLLIPFATDHFLMLPSLWKMDIYVRMESFLIPLLIVLLLAFNIYFLTQTSPSEEYFWNYYLGIYIQIVAQYSAVLAIQANLAHNFPDMILAILISCVALNLGVLTQVFAMIENEYSAWRSIWYACFGISTICNIYIARGWLNKYILSQKTGLKNQPDIYAFCKVSALTVFLIGYAFVNGWEVGSLSNTQSTLSTDGLTATSMLVVGLFYVTTEISHQRTKNLARFSIDALETKRAFVRYVSHEIRTPLNSACLGLQLLQKEIEKCSFLVNGEANSSDRRDGIEKIVGTTSPGTNAVGGEKKATNDITKTKETWLELVVDTHQACNIAVEILNDLLMYEKIDGGLMVLDASEVSLWPLMDEVFKMFSVQAKAMDLELICNYKKQPFDVFMMIDSYKISQVLRNLVSNALKFSPAGKQVVVDVQHIRASSNKTIFNRFSSNKRFYTSSAAIIAVTDDTDDVIQGQGKDIESQQSLPNNNNSSITGLNALPIPNYQVDMIRIAVTDVGAGISKENQRRLFHEIVQFDAAKLQQGKGSGIGLWISGRIMKLHGGDIGVYSAGEGYGCTFYVDIPVGHLQYHTHHNAATKYLISDLRHMIRGISGVPTRYHQQDVSDHLITSSHNPHDNPDKSSHNNNGTGAVAAHQQLSSLSHPSLQTNSPPLSMNSPVIPTSHSPNTDISPNSAPATPPPIGNKPKNKRVLIVDDSAMNRKFLKRTIAEMADSVDEAGNGRECLEKVKLAMANDNNNDNGNNGKGYEVIITDYFMPEMNGLEAIGKLRCVEIGYRGMIIGLTGNADSATKEAFEAAGADVVFTKPFASDKLQAALQKAFC